jgi:hypothetical protein
MFLMTMIKAPLRHHQYTSKHQNLLGITYTLMVLHRDLINDGVIQDNQRHLALTYFGYMCNKK